MRHTQRTSSSPQGTVATIIPTCTDSSCSQLDYRGFAAHYHPVGRSPSSQQGKPNNSRGVPPSTCSPDSFKWTKELLIRVPARSKIEFKLIDVEYPPTRDNIDSLSQPTTFRHCTRVHVSLPFVPLLHEQACRYLLAYQPFNDNGQSV